MSLDRYSDVDPVDIVLSGTPMAERRELVGACFHTFGEPAARALAIDIGVDFEDCREAIERLQDRPSRTDPSDALLEDDEF